MRAPIRTRLARTAALLAALAATPVACGSSPASPSMTVATTWTIGTSQPFSVDVNRRTMTVNGGFGLGYPCFTFSSRVDVSSDTITVTVRARNFRDVGGCILVVSAAAYTVTVDNVPRGSWRLQIDHELDEGSTKPPDVYPDVYHTTIDVR